MLRYCFFAMLGMALTLSGGSSRASTESLTQKVKLSRVKHFMGIATRMTTVDNQELPLKAEPKYSSGNVRRGVLQLHSDLKNWMAFAHDIGASKLYLDLNRDLDLTNDPDGVRSARGPASPMYDFDAKITRNGHTRTEHFEYQYYDRPNTPPNLHVYDWFSGELQVAGKTWKIGMPVDEQTTERIHLALARENRGNPSQTQASRDVPWVIDGNAYKFQVEGDPQTSDEITLIAIPSNAPMKELKLGGEIGFLQMAGTAIGIFDSPTSSILLPEGPYQVQTLRLPSDEQMMNYPMMNVTVDGSSVLNAGGPLSGKVRVKHQGMYLKLDMDSSGVGGEKYYGGRVGNNAQFAIFKGDRKIAQGNFQYG